MTKKRTAAIASSNSSEMPNTKGDKESPKRLKVCKGEGESKITVEEVKLYDRQIRLWGMEAQQRMRNAKILTLGQNSLMNELLKNIVLAGINHITLLSNKIVTEQDLGNQFLLTENELGKNNTIIKERLQKLNPRVDLQVIEQEIDQLTDEFVKEFHIVCMVGQTAAVISKINTICRKHNIVFWAGENMGKCLVTATCYCDLYSVLGTCYYYMYTRDSYPALNGFYLVTLVTIQFL